MNTFFYAAEKSGIYQDTKDRLCKISQLDNLTILPCGCQLNTPEALLMRSGDLMFLFAGNRKELEALTALHNDLEEFRIILLLRNLNDETVQKSHILNPRFITNVKGSWMELESIIDKIITADCCQWLLSTTKNC